MRTLRTIAAAALLALAVVSAGPSVSQAAPALPDHGTAVEQPCGYAYGGYSPSYNYSPCGGGGPFGPGYNPWSSSYSPYGYGYYAYSLPNATNYGYPTTYGYSYPSYNGYVVGSNLCTGCGVGWNYPSNGYFPIGSSYVPNSYGYGYSGGYNSGGCGGCGGYNSGYNYGYYDPGYWYGGGYNYGGGYSCGVGCPGWNYPGSYYGYPGWW